MIGVHSSLIPNQVIEYVGVPEASSFAGSDWLPKYGFRLENEISDQPWGPRDVSFPHSLWFKFKTSHVLTKIGFSTYGGNSAVKQAPKKFDVIASASPDYKNFQVLLHVEDAGFFGQNQLQVWEIPEEKQAPYPCIGIRIRTTNQQDAYTAVKNMIMWEKRL